MTHEQPDKQAPLKWWSSPRVLVRQILQLDDTPHSIALGVAIGMFVGLTPTVGAQMIIVVVLAMLTRTLFNFNRVAALLTVYVSNPLTMVPLYWFNYEVGTWFVGGDFTREQFAKVLEYDGLEQWWQTVVALFVGVGEPLLIGSAVVATTGGLISYPLMRWLIRWFRGSGDPPVRQSQDALTTSSPQ